jgi:CRP/FNR family cyclic AMP-dependent transcriptional regulator
VTAAGSIGVTAATLAAMPLFATLTPQARTGLAARLGVRPVGRGDLVFQEGEQGAEVFLVLTGKVKILRTAADGRENLLAVLGPGEVFGELSLFDPGPRTATARALEAGELASLAHDQLQTWLAERPDAAGVLLRVLARRLRRTNDAMTDLVFTDVPGRVAKALLALAERFGQPRDGGIAVAHGLTQEELAQLVGASRETVNKALADFAARGWLRLGTRSVVVLDEQRLARRAR